MTLCATGDREIENSVEKQWEEGQPVYYQIEAQDGKPRLCPATVVRKRDESDDPRFVTVKLDEDVLRYRGRGGIFGRRFDSFYKQGETRRVPSRKISERRNLAEPCGCACHDFPTYTVAHVRPCCNFESKTRALAQLSCEEIGEKSAPKARKLLAFLKANWLDCACIGIIVLVGIGGAYTDALH